MLLSTYLSAVVTTAIFILCINSEFSGLFHFLEYQVFSIILRFHAIPELTMEPLTLSKSGRVALEYGLVKTLTHSLTQSCSAHCA